MAKQVSSEFVALFEQHHAQIAEGHVMNETFVHFADKLLAMLKDDYKTLYELEKKEHEELLAETRPKTIWPASSSLPSGFVGGTVSGFGASATGAELCATATGWSGEEPHVADCALHGPMERTNEAGGAALCHTANSRGYSLYSPPCNGCPMGKSDAEKGLWMSGFAGKTNVFISARPDFQEPLHTPPHSPIERVCPGAPQRPSAALCATASTWGASAPLSPIEQIPDDHF